MNKLVTLFCFLALTTSVQAAQESSAQVNVEMNGQYRVSFDGPVRLNDVLNEANQVLEHPEVYWPEARLGIVGDVEFEQSREDLFADVRKAVEENAELAPYLQQLEQLNYVYQPFHQIDIAKTRQKIAYNPVLQAENYALSLPVRPDSIYVLGAVNEPQRMAFQTGTPLSAYLRELRRDGQLRGEANRQFAYLVRDGEVHQVKWSLYNSDGREAKPGDVIWLGFDDTVFPAAAALQLPSTRAVRTLNKEIAQLLTHLQTLPELSKRELEIDTPSERHWSRYDHYVSRNNYGDVGLLQTPTARMAEAGSVGLSFSDMEVYRRYTVSLQVLSWLEANAFYVRIPNRLYSDVPGFSGTNIYTDKGFDVKARVWEESYWLPEFSVGLRDFAGTGLFDGEYVVANKRFGAFDVSLGIGFGRLGTRGNISNPFCEVYNDFCERPSGFSRGGGQFEYDQWFRGEAALFGGVQWQTPIEPLTIKVEYDGNDFSLDDAGVPIEPSTPWNVGFNYRAFDWLDLQASYERGNTFTFNVTMHTNFNHLGQHRVQPARVEPRPTPEAQTLDDVDWVNVSSRLFRNYSMSVTKADGDEERVTVYMVPNRYRDPDERIDRAARILADELPAEVAEYEFVQTSFNRPMVSTTVDANAFKAKVWHTELGSSPEDTADLFERQLPEPARRIDEEDMLYNPERTPHYTGYGVKPFFHQDFGSPEDFHIYQLGATAFGRYWFGSNFEVFGELGFNIKNNYHKFNFLEDIQGGLPPVRTNARFYVQNDVWLDRLEATYYDKLSDNLYFKVYGGYLERMFSGVGTEMLYRPVDSNWAFGFDVNRVRQRDFDGWMGLDEYYATTGFASVYYQMPWLEDSVLQLDVGQFLAEDRGVNVTFQKRFDSGVTVGAYAAFTNVSQEDYGEGSFTKGFFMSIPFDLIGVRPTRQRVGMHWIPLARNGGRQLARRGPLWSVTDDLSPFYHR